MKLLTLCFTLLISALSLNAQTIRYVTPSGSGSENAKSWENASSNLYAVLSAARPGTEVRIAGGTYTPTYCEDCRPEDRKMAFKLRSGVRVIGGFAGTETTDQPTGNKPTILSGEIGDSLQITDNSYHVLTCYNCAGQTQLERLTIRSGYADREYGGGGLLIKASKDTLVDLVVKETIFENNHSPFSGGAVAVIVKKGEVAPVFQSTKFLNNQSSTTGGALSITQTGGTAAPIFVNVKFIENTTQSLDGRKAGAGGALYIDVAQGSMHLQASRTTFIGNATGVSSTGNFIINTLASGGAVFLNERDDANLEVTFNSSIFHNNAAYSAGAIYNHGAKLNIQNVNLTSNTARGSGGAGGALYLNAGKTNIVNSIFSKNTVSENPTMGADFRQINADVSISYSAVDAVDATVLFNRANDKSEDKLNVGSGMLYQENLQLNLDEQLGYPVITGASSLVVDHGTKVVSDFKQDFFGNVRTQGNGIDIGASELNRASAPVELIDFTAKRTSDGIQLNWEAQLELDLAGYQLSRIDEEGVERDLIYIPGMEIGNYSFRDIATTEHQAATYRLEAIDGAGKVHPLEETSIEADQTEEVIYTKLEAESQNRALHIELNPELDGKAVYLSIISAEGKRIKFWPIETSAIDVTELAYGDYTVRVLSGNSSQSQIMTLGRK